jgi:hypothetical protein
MPRSYALSYLPLLYNALEEEIGLYVRTDAQQKLMDTLYEARKSALDDALQELMLFRIGTDVLYIAKRSTELPE